MQELKQKLNQISNYYENLKYQEICNRINDYTINNGFHLPDLNGWVPILGFKNEMEEFEIFCNKKYFHIRYKFHSSSYEEKSDDMPHSNLELEVINYLLKKFQESKIKKLSVYDEIMAVKMKIKSNLSNQFGIKLEK